MQDTNIIHIEPKQIHHGNDSVVIQNVVDEIDETIDQNRRILTDAVNHVSEILEQYTPDNIGFTISPDTVRWVLLHNFSKMAMLYHALKENDEDVLEMLDTDDETAELQIYNNMVATPDRPFYLSEECPDGSYYYASISLTYSDGNIGLGIKVVRSSDDGDEILNVESGKWVPMETMQSLTEKMQETIDRDNVQSDFLQDILAYYDGELTDAEWKRLKNKNNALIQLKARVRDLMSFKYDGNKDIVSLVPENVMHTGFSVRQKGNTFELYADIDPYSFCSDGDLVYEGMENLRMKVGETTDQNKVVEFIQKHTNVHISEDKEMITMPLSWDNVVSIKAQEPTLQLMKSRYRKMSDSLSREEKDVANKMFSRLQRA